MFNSFIFDVITGKVSVSPFLPSFMLNRYFLVCYFNSFVISIFFSLEIIFFVVVLGIMINIVMYIKLVWIHTNLISLVYKNLAHVKLCSFPLICAVRVIQITPLYIVCPSKQNCNYYFVWLSFKSDRTKTKLQTKKYFCAVFYI